MAEAPPPTRAAEIAEVLRDRIANHEALPGARLRERELADEFGVARARVRDALAILESRGLIARIPNRGAVVTRLDLAQVFHLYEVREVLEGLAVRLATEHTAPESWQDLVDFFAGPMSTFVDQGNLDGFVDGYAEFRSRVTEAAANPELTDMLDSIYDKTQVLIRRTIVLPGRAEVGLEQHQAVLAAMRQGDAGLAEKLRRQNMISAREYLERYEQFIL